MKNKKCTGHHKHQIEVLVENLKKAQKGVCEWWTQIQPHSL